MTAPMQDTDALARDLRDAWNAARGPEDNAWRVVARLVQQKIVLAQREAFRAGVGWYATTFKDVGSAKAEAAERYPFPSDAAPSALTPIAPPPTPGVHTGVWGAIDALTQTVRECVTALNDLRARPAAPQPAVQRIEPLEEDLMLTARLDTVRKVNELVVAVNALRSRPASAPEE